MALVLFRKRMIFFFFFILVFSTVLALLQQLAERMHTCDYELFGGVCMFYFIQKWLEGY